MDHYNFITSSTEEIANNPDAFHEIRQGAGLQVLRDIDGYLGPDALESKITADFKTKIQGDVHATVMQDNPPAEGRDGAMIRIYHNEKEIAQIDPAGDRTYVEGRVLAYVFGGGPPADSMEEAVNQL